MILTVTTTHKPATDLGFLLHKNPARLHTAEMTFGKAHVFYSEACEERCTAVLMLEVDPVGLVRGRGGAAGEGGLFGQYVNDRPYVASSFLSSAITEMFGTAMNGRSKERQELADSDIHLEARLPVIPCRGGEIFLRRLFEPLGYEVEATRRTLQERFPEWGDSRYFDVTLRKQGRLKDLLNHLYVMIPVLDDEKHYYVGSDEVEKLLRKGESWLANHPAKSEITERYLRRRKLLTREALARLAEEETGPEPDETEAQHSVEEEKLEKTLSLHEMRLHAVLAALVESGARSVLDVGCGEGKLIQLLLKERQFGQVVGMDVSLSVLERAERKLRVEQMPTKVKERLKLLHGSLMYRDSRLADYDAAAVVEVIEHLDEPRLQAFERTLFEAAAPRSVVVTTPNAEYNVLFPTLPAGSMRHKDHRFEWTRKQFEGWASATAEKYGYNVKFTGIGDADPEVGAPSQMAIFEKQ